MADDSEISFSVDDSDKFIDKRCSNVKSDLIEITHDKLENILLKHLHCLKYRKEWMAPLSIFITLLVTIITVTFNDFGLEAEVWEAIFIVCALFTFILFMRSIILLIKYWNSMTIDSLIDKIKAVNK
ncbi:MAG: hypothetical protein GQ533_10295 [Methanosarcinaceae archaeon]|nr:hypothetical protein [Methanosarcinaceae archaeon]